jgi:hypothetical protein
MSTRSQRDVLSELNRLSAAVAGVNSQLEAISAEVQSLSKQASKRAKTEYSDPDFALVDAVVQRMLEAESEVMGE